MAPEQQANQYIEQAKLADVTEVEKQLRLDPSKFDENLLRKEFKDRLDKVVGKRELNGRQIIMYGEALRKIEANIATLREIRDYVATKIKMVEIEKYVKEGGLPKNIDAGIRYAIYLADYNTLANFALARPPKGIKPDEYVADIGRANAAILGVGELMKAYMREQFKKVGSREQKRIQYSMDVGNVNLIDYMALSDAVEDLTELMHDKQATLDKMAESKPAQAGQPKMLRWGEADPALDDLADEANDRLVRMGQTLTAATEFLNREDRLAVQNFDRAMMLHNNKWAREVQSNALNYRAMMYNKRMAERNKAGAAAIATDQSGFEEADRLFAQAEKEAKRDPSKADGLYRQASLAYENMKQTVLAQRSKKKGPNERGSALA